LPRPPHRPTLFPYTTLFRSRGGVTDAIDASQLVLLVVAEDADALAVAEAGVAALRHGTDVVALADRGVAERGPADLVAPPDEFRQSGPEGARPGLDADQLPGAGMRGQPAA